MTLFGRNNVREFRLSGARAAVAMRFAYFRTRAAFNDTARGLGIPSLGSYAACQGFNYSSCSGFTDLTHPTIDTWSWNRALVGDGPNRSKNTKQK